MALGYEGLVKLGNYYVLGTGSSVPRTRSRLESSSGYGGVKDFPTNQIGIGAPFNYDWSQTDGSINFEMTKDIFDNELKGWIVGTSPFGRQSYKEILLASRKDNVQQFDTCFFNSISISAGEGAAVDCSVGFVAMQRDVYTWGDQYKNNRMGISPACPAASFPPFLNPSATPNQNPIPFWNTKITVTAIATPKVKNFVNWSLDVSQDVVKFFACEGNASVQPPKYVAVGPMTVMFSGSYMDDFTGAENGFLGDHLTEVDINIAGVTLKLKRLELNSESDDVQTGDAFVPLTVEYAAYELAA